MIKILHGICLMDIFIVQLVHDFPFKSNRDHLNVFVKRINSRLILFHSLLLTLTCICSARTGLFTGGFCVI